MNSMWVKNTVPKFALEYFCKEKEEKGEEEAWRSEAEEGGGAAAAAPPPPAAPPAEAIGKSLSNC